MRSALRVTAAAACTLWLLGAGSASAPKTKREPASQYPSLEAVRDSVLALVRRTVAPLPPKQVVAAPSHFNYWSPPDSVAGYTVRVALKEGPECRADLVGEALMKAGWTPNYQFSADGTDGTAMGYVMKNYFCEVRGRWDGGDDMDTTYVVTSCELIVTCVPWREEDRPK